jgi:excisionase family DNA binding protein
MSEEHNTDQTVASFPPVMTVDQVAAYLQVSKRTVYNMVAAGELPGAKVGDQWRFYRPEIDRWLMVLSRQNVGDSTPVEPVVEGAAHGDL